MKKLILISLAVMITGCAALPSKPVFLTGQWGGPGIDLLIEGGITTVQFDCAGGSIDTNMAAAGPFSAVGTYRAGQIGPVRVGQIFTSQKATYAGTVTDDAMTMSVRLEDGSMVGPFTLSRGTPGQITPCR